MKKAEFKSQSTKYTIDLGSKIARCLKKGDILCLYGELGSGKTTFTKGVAKALKVDEKKVTSPTFVLLNVHKGRLPLFHFDLYRIDNPADMLTIGYEEFFFGNGISVVEWSEKLGELKPKDAVTIRFKNCGRDTRSISICQRNARGREIVKKML